MPTAIPGTLGGPIPGFDSVTGSYLAAGLVVAVAMVASRTLARRTGLPYPVFLVVAGVAAGFLPGMGDVALDPRVVFLGFLPPLVYHAGIVTSPRELRAHALPIGLGALGLVLATTFAVAGLAWATVPVLGWAGAFVLGAVVAPTDPVAATSVFGRLGVPPGVTTVLEGEGLVNDGVALALFSIGVAAVVSPTSLAGGLLAFVRWPEGGRPSVWHWAGWRRTSAGRSVTLRRRSWSPFSSRSWRTSRLTLSGCPGCWPPWPPVWWWVSARRGSTPPATSG